MSTSIPWLKCLFATLIILISFTGFNHGQEIKNINTVNRPVILQNIAQTKALNSNCGPTSDQFCYLTEALNFIFFDGNGNKTDIDTLLDRLADNTTLDDIFYAGLLVLQGFPETYPTLIPGETKKNTNL
jgi:hypothetical protein